jgi:hypothetical protein
MASENITYHPIWPRDLRGAGIVNEVRPDPESWYAWRGRCCADSSPIEIAVRRFEDHVSVLVVRGDGEPARAIMPVSLPDDSALMADVSWILQAVLDEGARSAGSFDAFVGPADAFPKGRSLNEELQARAPVVNVTVTPEIKAVLEQAPQEIVIRRGTDGKIASAVAETIEGEKK